MTYQILGVDKPIVGIFELNLIKLKANIWMHTFKRLLDSYSFEVSIHFLNKA